MSGCTTTSCGMIAALAAAIGLSACGGGARLDAGEPRASFTVEVLRASFPASQSLSQHTHLVIQVRNAGSRTIPDVAVTLTDPSAGTAAQAFGGCSAPTSCGAPPTGSSQGDLASRSRPVWIIDRPPGLCGYSCQSGGPGGAVTAYSNTWALGALKPGATATFDWGVTAVKPGTHVIQYVVAAGLNGRAQAVLSDGNRPTGRFNIRVSQRPSQSYVNDQGQIIKSP